MREPEVREGDQELPTVRRDRFRWDMDPEPIRIDVRRLNYTALPEVRWRPVFSVPRPPWWRLLARRRWRRARAAALARLYLERPMIDLWS